MTAAYLPSILTPLIGLIFPGLAMAFAFIYIEQDEVGQSPIFNLKTMYFPYQEKFSFINYKEDPTPEYEPQKNNPTTVKAKMPPTVPISHKGILPVLAIYYFLPIY